MDPRISVISTIVEIPIITGALYAFDIDDTLLELVRVWNEEQYLLASSVDRRKICKVWQLHDPRIPAYLEELSKVASLIYITRRLGDPETRNLTIQQFKQFSIPLEPIYFADDEKSLELLQHINTKGGRDAFIGIHFADNRDDECRDVLKNVPGVKVYRVDPKLTTKLKARERRKTQ
jgi:ethanolamine ammonia-lyase large subunit